MGKLKCYISGPIVKGEHNCEKFSKWEQRLTQDLGVDCYNPTEIDEGMSFEVYTQMRLMALALCDCIFFMPGWEESKSSRLEMRYAKACGLKIIMANKTGNLCEIITDKGRRFNTFDESDFKRCYHIDLFGNEVK